jgi:isobutyryl-CoA mutase
MQAKEPYKLKNHVRIVTAASLFDGHDATVNIIRRILQSSGAEVIHLGHNRSVQEIVQCAVQEDAQAIAITSYQGGHMEFFVYMLELLNQHDCGHIKVFGGGGGVILPDEIRELHKIGVTRIYSPDDGREMGLQGMINHVLENSDFPTGINVSTDFEKLAAGDVNTIARLISAAENAPEDISDFLKTCEEKAAQSPIPVLGITGTGGSGKSSLVDEIVRRFLDDNTECRIAIISVDPSKRKSGGALLGDRIRMNAINTERVYMRSLATRQSNLALSRYVKDAISIVKCAPFDLVIIETSGIGQSDTEIVDHSDISMYVMTPDYGAATQLEKIDMLDFADIIALNKFDKRGAMDALHYVRKQYIRNHQLWEADPEKLPVFGTTASQFNDSGVNELYKGLVEVINNKTGKAFHCTIGGVGDVSEKIYIIPPNRTRYLSEITETIRNYNQWTEEQSDIARKLQSVKDTIEAMQKSDDPQKETLIAGLQKQYDIISAELDPANLRILEHWPEKRKCFSDEEFVYTVRDKEFRIKTYTESLSHIKIPKVALPRYKSWGDILKWNLRENVPGDFPYAAGVFPFKREEEDPTRMFAGEGAPERTNKRFHYVSYGMPAIRLSTAFDSPTLYGENPHTRPDIYGKIGNAGVSICCLDDAKKLYSGFDLSDQKTSVSMTINGPAPMLVGFFLNAAIDQECEKYIRQNGLEAETEKKIAALYKEKGTERPGYRGPLPQGNNGLGLMLLGITGDRVLPADCVRKHQKRNHQPCSRNRAG